MIATFYVFKIAEGWTVWQNESRCPGLKYYLCLIILGQYPRLYHLLVCIQIGCHSVLFVDFAFAIQYLVFFGWLQPTRKKINQLFSGFFPQFKNANSLSIIDEWNIYTMVQLLRKQNKFKVEAFGLIKILCYEEFSPMVLIFCKKFQPLKTE